MTTSIIDVAFHGTTFPSSYIGVGTLIGNPRVAASVVERVSGFFTSNGNAVQINCGFRPTRVNIVNTTDGITWEYLYGMPAANSVKIVLGGSLAGTQDTGSAITLNDGGGGNYSVTLSSTLCGTAKNIVYQIEG